MFLLEWDGRIETKQWQDAGLKIVSLDPVQTQTQYKETYLAILPPHLTFQSGGTVLKL